MFCRQRCMCSALCWCDFLCITLCVTHPVLYYPVSQSVVYHPIVGCRCLQHLPPPQCAVSSTHFAMVVKATRAGILWNWDILELWVFTIDLAEENDFHIANISNITIQICRSGVTSMIAIPWHVPRNSETPSNREKVRNELYSTVSSSGTFPKPNE